MNSAPLRALVASTTLFALLLGPLFSAEKPFTGRLVFEQTAKGGSGEEAFRGLAADKVTITIGSNAYRQDENSGLNEGSIIIRDGSKSALRLDHDKKTSERGSGMKLDDMDAKTKQFMPAHFTTDLIPTKETATIAGHATKKYKVTKSPFLRAGATAHLWIAEDLEIGRHRYNFEFEYHRIIAPIPMSIPVTKGTVLKAEILENETRVTITATEVTKEEPDASLFLKPENYEGPDFPVPPKTLPAPTGPKVDLSTLSESIKNEVGMTLLLIKPGTFKMGSPTDEPNRHKDEAQHEVTLSRPYYISTTEITQGQWKAVMGTDSPSRFKGDDLPVEKVTWSQANEFCKALSAKEGRTYRLPTEAEWEYAARAGETFDFKSMSMKTRKAWIVERAWTSLNSEYKSHPVASLKPNAWGLFDTFGNVDEWTSSGTGPYPAGPVTDPQGTDSTSKITRGNGWVSSYDWIRPASRSNQPMDQPKSTIGFRIVCEAK